MPLYEYHCDHCGHHFEVLTSMAERDNQWCFKCCETGAMIRRVLSAPAIQYSYPAGSARSGRGGTGGTPKL